MFGCPFGFFALNRRQGLSVLLMGLLLLGVGVLPLSAAHAEKYQSRLNSLLLKKSDLYMPTRLVLGEEARFVVKAQPGSQVRVFLSPQGEGYMLPNGTPLRVGEEVQELGGTVPENGVLELGLTMPQDPELDGKVLYIDAVSGVSDEQMAPLGLIDANGHRTGTNVLVIAKPADRGGPAIFPSMPGMDPRLLNRLTTLGTIYSKKDDPRRDLIDNGDIDQEREMDRNPFINRGLQQGPR